MKLRLVLPCLVIALVLVAVLPSSAQTRARKAKKAAQNETQRQEETKPGLNAETFRGLALRGIGPAVLSGRIADIVVQPADPNTWYVAAGSGGVWKTINRGTTWTPIFDGEGSYSIGCLTLDPSNPEIVWVGTGENVSGRHVGFGDGIYRSLDGGTSWKKMGLEASEHISKILIDPRDSNILLVAAEGPLWSAGGERGVYRTEDGGASWTAVLAPSEDTGATDLVRDPFEPDVLYAAAYQRRRHVWSFLAGGPESGIHKSTDGGLTWRRLTQGLPAGDMGKIGLAASPLLRGVVYATVEADEEEKGVYRSADFGESWHKGSGAISGGTGPHYYQELYASPHVPDRLYQMDVWIDVSDDGGTSFRALGEPDKHSDNHAFAFDPEDPDHLLAGCDGGVYETFDHGESWRFLANLPLTQFYKIAVDEAEPIYHIAGGTQDNGTQHGPSRTLSVHGVRNQDWKVPLGADGYACQLDPELPNLLYAETQVGSLTRIDLATGEVLDLQPQPEPGDPPERWNWDAPILISPHASERLYYGSYRLWRSDDRGDSWRAVSGDLTRGKNRYELELMGRVWSVDDLYDNGAMSQYATLTSVAESPLAEGLLYTGSDDGVIAVSEDGGETWRRIESLPGVPELAFVNELTASPLDADTVFAALSHHKQGDFQPYLLRSTDRGRTWTSIAGDLPERHLVWSVAQDHENGELLFAGTEFGIFFTVDGGGHWVKLDGGVPTIAFRDLVLQRREGDLVAGSFGRGIFILDDYAPLRQASVEALQEEAHLYPVRDAGWYVPSMDLAVRGRGYQGSSYFTAPNPPFGAVFTVYLKDAPKTGKDLRREAEAALREEWQDIPFPGWETLEAEALEKPIEWLLSVSNDAGAVVRRLPVPATAGFQRIAWDLRWPALEPVSLEDPGPLAPWSTPDQGPLVIPGSYRVSLGRWTAGGLETVGEEQVFEVKRLENSTLPAPDAEQMAAFQRRTGELYRRVLGAAEELQRGEETVQQLVKALVATPAADPGLLADLRAVEKDLFGLSQQLLGDRVRRSLQEPSAPSIVGRVSQITYGHWETRSGPTRTHKRNLEVAEETFARLLPELRRALEVEIPRLEQAFEAAGAPWTSGRALPGLQDK